MYPASSWGDIGLESSVSRTEAVWGGRWPGMKGRSSVVLVGADAALRLFRFVAGTSSSGLRGGRPVVDAACGREAGC